MATMHKNNPRARLTGPSQTAYKECPRLTALSGTFPRR